MSLDDIGGTLVVCGVILLLFGSRPRVSVAVIALGVAAAVAAAWLPVKP